MLLVLLMPLAACVGQAPPPPPRAVLPRAPLVQAPPPPPARARIGLLLPLSGANRPLGEAMLQAAQLALFDQAEPGVEFLPRDTASTPAGAAEAARSALAEGARALAGPLTLAETAAAAGPARAAEAPMLAFTSDAGQAGRGVWVLGITPAEQAGRIAEAATAAGARRFGLLAADDELGRRLAAGFRDRLAALGQPAPLVVLHPRLGDTAAAARDLAAQAGPEGLGAVLIGLTGERARLAAGTLQPALPRPARLFGTAAWAQEPGLGQEPALAGALFPGPDPAARANFEARFQAAFGDRPPRLAGVAYDAAALASRAARSGGGTPPLGQAMLGADGPVRLLPDGLAQHGLALFALEAAGEPRLVQPAPIPGAAGS